jgi:hypothetical protein
MSPLKILPLPIRLLNQEESASCNDILTFKFTLNQQQSTAGSIRFFYPSVNQMIKTKY